jgi:hypothetical protein
MKMFMNRPPISLEYENIDLLWKQVPDVGVEALIAFLAMKESDQESVAFKHKVKLQNQIQTNRVLKNHNLLEGRQRL